MKDKIIYRDLKPIDNLTSAMMILPIRQTAALLSSQHPAGLERATDDPG